MKKDSSKKKTGTIRYFLKAMKNFKKGFYLLYAVLILALIAQPILKMFAPKMMIDPIMGNGGIESIIKIKIAFHLGNVWVPGVVTTRCIIDLEEDRKNRIILGFRNNIRLLVDIK